ncbi:DNA replication/repair protein RecF [Francisella philomiragia]|uniref:DNA replication/repair protein RecF n=1 Tax=Francisella philomiragia TaxID=28110 RepID=UPI00190766BD|nr:DNA replication/repair protein RecF [Francisella philomiragia]MBK2106810.1 DNA replication/repair protein RecF [Francisella philomiragia]MBK2295660.1 DNA replication/repair protein RecF [Francisella philomiragia]MBK2340456.1 DNA replication/repair protein RecF [Francisella philomiragia]
MYIANLRLQNFRNIPIKSFDFKNSINFIVGKNGSGKTSILESIYFLSHSRSFRSSQLNRIINHDSDEFIIYTKAYNPDEVVISLSRKKNSNNISKLNSEIQKNHTEITRVLPIQLMNPESFNIINSGAQQRCKVLDWGAFYLDKTFLKIWQQTKFLIKQRNSALKQNYPKIYIEGIDKKLCEFADILDYKRQAYFTKLKPKIYEVLSQFNPDLKLDIDYFRGWNSHKSLVQVLEESFESDNRYNVTNHGPHKADIVLTINHKPIQDIFSRGQQKLLICAIKLAQGEIHNSENENKCIYLIDDITSELDNTHTKTLFSYLKNLKSQVFITTTEKNKIIDFLDLDSHIIEI